MSATDYLKQLNKNIIDYGKAHPPSPTHESFVEKLGDKIISGPSSIASSIADSISTVYNDATSGVVYIAKSPERVLNTGVGVVDHGIDASANTISRVADDTQGLGSSLGQSLSLPLVFGGVAALALVLMK